MGIPPCCRARRTNEIVKYILNPEHCETCAFVRYEHPDGRCKCGCHLPTEAKERFKCVVHGYNHVKGCVDCDRHFSPAPKASGWRHDKGDKARRWKGDAASVNAFHKWLNVNYGKPTFCTSDTCEGRSDIFEWCLRRGHTYSHDPRDFLWLCRSCHRSYDLTIEKVQKATKNLWWSKGITHPNIQGKNGTERKVA